MFHQGFKHSKTIKALGLRPHAFISFLVFETLMKHSHSFLKYYLKVKKNGVFLFVIFHLVPAIFKIFVLCKLGTDDVIRCDNPFPVPFPDPVLDPVLDFHVFHMPLQGINSILNSLC